MKNVLILAKKFIIKFNKSRKFRLFVFVLAAKILISALVLVIMGLLVYQPKDAQAAYGLDTNIRQVKLANSPTVYYLDHRLGLKKAYITAEAFLSYGNQWSDIKIISQAQLDKWPDVKLVKQANDINIYYISGNKKALIKGPSDFANFGFDYSKVVTISQIDFLSFQTADYDAVGLTSVIKSAGGNPDMLTVSLNQDSPQSGYLPTNSNNILVAVFDFKAGSSPVEIKSIIVKAEGFFNFDNIKNVYLANEADYVFTRKIDLDGRLAEFNLMASPLIIPASETKKIKVYVDVKSLSDFANQWAQFTITNAVDIETSAAVYGCFPVAGGQYKFADGSILGNVKIEELALNLGSQLIIGETQKNIGKFKISETTGQENVNAKKIVLKNINSARADSLANFKLKDSNNNIVAQAVGMENNEVIFNLNNFTITKGQDRTVFLYADIIGGENKKVNFNLKDFYSSGSNYGYSLPFSQIDSNETFSITHEQLKILSKDLNSSQRVFSSQTGVIIGNFQIRNNNQKNLLENLTLTLEKTATALPLDHDIYLVNYDTGAVYDSETADRLSGSFSLSFNSLEIKPRQQINFSLVTNLPYNAVSGDKYRVIVNEISYKSENGSYFEDALAVSGSYLTVTKSSLYIYPNNSDEDEDRSYVKGQKNVKIASFYLESAAGDDLNISQITLVKSGDTSGAVLYENGFSNLRLYIGGAKVGKPISQPSTASLVFDNFNYRFSASKRVELKLVADTEADLKVSQVKLVIAGITAKSKNSGEDSVISGLNSASREVYFGESKAEIIALNGGSFTPGIKANNIGRFSIANTGIEDIKLDSINIFTTNDGISYSLGFSNLSVFDASTLKRVGYISRPVAGANNLKLNSYIIKSGQTAEFIIRVDANDAVPTSGFEIYLSQLKARGKKSNLTVSLQGDPTNKIPVNFTSFADTGSGDDNSSGDQEVNVVLKWPVSSRKVTYGFHDPDYPLRDLAEHNGIDIETSQGSRVSAAAGGIVVALADNHTTAYNYITIDHGNGIKTSYGHLSDVSVKFGDTVKQGQQIGLSGGKPGTVGAGANTNGPHLHLEVIENGVNVNPMEYLK